MHSRGNLNRNIPEIRQEIFASGRSPHGLKGIKVISRDACKINLFIPAGQRRDACNQTDKHALAAD